MANMVEQIFGPVKTSFKDEIEKFSTDRVFTYNEAGVPTGVNKDAVFFKNDTKDYKDNYLRTIRGILIGDAKHGLISRDAMVTAVNAIHTNYPHLLQDLLIESPKGNEL